MKLRNKYTGEIVDLSEGLIKDIYNGKYIQLQPDAIIPEGYRYSSLHELNEEWEDYEPKEPLIKDEKICKAVRAWAEANNIEWVEVRDKGVTLGFLGQDFEEISFNPYKDIKEGSYTIAELCGDE